MRAFLFLCSLLIWGSSGVQLSGSLVSLPSCTKVDVCRFYLSLNANEVVRAVEIVSSSVTPNAFYNFVGGNVPPLDTVIASVPLAACDSYVSMGIEVATFGTRDCTAPAPDFTLSTAGLSGSFYCNDPQAPQLGDSTQARNFFILQASTNTSPSTNVTITARVYFPGATFADVTASCFASGATSTTTAATTTTTTTTTTATTTTTTTTTATAAATTTTTSPSGSTVSTSTGITNAATSTTSTTSSTTSTSSSSSSNAWIAGAVIGGLVGAVLLIVGGVFLWKKLAASSAASSAAASSSSQTGGDYFADVDWNDRSYGVGKSVGAATTTTSSSSGARNGGGGQQQNNFGFDDDQDVGIDAFF